MKPRRVRALNLPSVVSLFFAVALSVLPASATAQQKEELPHPKTLEELLNAMKDVAAREHVPGAGIALIANGNVLWCGGIGKADIAGNRDVTCDTEFRVGSISKTFVALALLKLQDDGKINLYARLQDVAPEIPMRNPWAASHPVRVVNLLEHTAGFDDMRFAEIYNRRDPWDFPLLKVFQRFPGPQDVRWPPGTRFSYSNPGYGIAGYLIEKVSGQPFDVYIQQNILTPLGITLGDFRLTDANRTALAQGYEANPARAVPYKNIYLRPAGDMKASPGELAKLAQFFLRRGWAGDVQLFKTETVGRMEYPETVSSAKNGLRLGYGLANYTEHEGGVITHGHDGGIDGFLSSYRYMPEQNWGYVVLLNSTVSGQALDDMNQLAIDFLSRDFPKPQQPMIPLAAKELKKFTGFYAPRAPRDQLLAFTDDLMGGTWIRSANGRLLRSGLFGKSEKLFPVGKNLFRAEKDPEATAVFFRDATGRMIYVASGSDGEPYAERIFIPWPYVRTALLAVSALVMASAVLFALVWGLLFLFGRLKNVKHLHVRIVPLLAVVTFAAAVFAFIKSAEDVGVLTFWSATVFLTSLLFTLLSLIGLFLANAVPRDEIRKGVRIHSLLVSMACCVVMVFLSAWHLIGLRLWAP